MAVKRMIGDSRPSHLYSKPFTDEEQAQSICDIVCKYCPALPSFNGVKPKVHFTGHTHNRRRYGYCKQEKMIIGLSIPSWGILAHELAHIGTHGHGYEFKEAHMEILDLMERLARE